MFNENMCTSSFDTASSKQNEESNPSLLHFHSSSGIESVQISFTVDGVDRRVAYTDIAVNEPFLYDQ
jgi:hypothetical protein